jgi:hypothetical protein
MSTTSASLSTPDVFPDEIILNVMRGLNDCKDHISVMQSCKKLRNIGRESWRKTITFNYKSITPFFQCVTMSNTICGKNLADNSSFCLLTTFQVPFSWPPSYTLGPGLRRLAGSSYRLPALRDIKIYSDVQQREYTWSVNQTAELSKHALWARYLPHLTEDVSSIDLIAYKEEGTEVAMRASALYGPGTCAVSSRCEQWKVTTGEHTVRMAILLLTMDFGTECAASDDDETYSREEALESFGNCLSSLLLNKADWGASAYLKIINLDKDYILTNDDLSEVVG